MTDDLAQAFQAATRPVACPDCGADWPPIEWRCPGCLLSLDDLAAAAELLERIAGGSGTSVQPVALSVVLPRIPRGAPSRDRPDQGHGR